MPLHRYKGLPEVLFQTKALVSKVLLRAKPVDVQDLDGGPLTPHLYLGVSIRSPDVQGGALRKSPDVCGGSIKKIIHL